MSAHHDHHHAPTEGLTRNQALVMRALSQARAPLTAYTILDELRAEGFRAPPQVYRALEKLVEIGMVHRLESLNAFVACRHPDCDGHETVAFAICDDCGQVAELSDDRLAGHLKAIAGETGFILRKSMVELRGRCADCARAAAAPA
ncbi:transcriptional repressor [Stappia sp.]|jgi:Fur family zinc uptake transcriptional regulator|uniref:transcriptional repressor n=1 Tax=Stappia sp. TaxID=1870903 RepID=UPI003A98FE77